MWYVDTLFICFNFNHQSADPHGGCAPGEELGRERNQQGAGACQDSKQPLQAVLLFAVEDPAHWRQHDQHLQRCANFELVVADR